MIIKKAPPLVDDILYLKPQEVLSWISSASSLGQGQQLHKKFIELLEKNAFTDLHLLVGYNEV